VSAPPSPVVLLRLIALTGSAGAIISRVQGSLLEGRLQGLGLNPNYLAVYLAPAIVIAVGLALRSRNPLWLLPGALCVPALLASQSREGLLAMLAGLAFLMIQGRSPGLKLMAGLVALAGVITFHTSVASILSLGAGSRSVSDLTNDNLVRDHVALFAMHVAIGHPLLGIGVGQFPSYAASISGIGIYITATNEYLLLAAETGVICLAAFLILLWLAVKDARAGDLAVLRAAVVTSAASMLFVDSFGSPVVTAPFWACLGVLLAFPRAAGWPAADRSQDPTVNRTEIAR
jgi:O-Antigen ligase